MKKFLNFLFLFLCIFYGNILFALIQNENNLILKEKEFVSEEIWLTQQLDEVSKLRNFLNPNLLEEFEKIKEESGGNWIILIDRITGKPGILEGKGIEWIKDKEKNLNEKMDYLVQKAISFLEEHNYLFEIDVKDLKLNELASGPVLDYLYFLHFNWNYKGIPVENAQIIFRLNHGNLVQIGQENISSSIKNLDLEPKISINEAWEILWKYLDGKDEKDSITEKGRLVIIPVSMF